MITNPFPPHARAQELEPIAAPHEIVGIEVKTSDLHYPLYTSIKFNGVRGVLLNDTFRSRAMLQLNIHNTLLFQLQPLIDYAMEHKLVFDGEFHAYSDNTTGGTMSILAGNKKIPYDFKYKIFAIYTYKQWNGGDDLFMKDMQDSPYWELLSAAPPISMMELVLQELVEDKDELEELAAKVQTNPLIEGLMLAAPSLHLQHRRIRVLEKKFFKMKFYSDPIDGQIIGIRARQEHIPGIESETNVLGKAQRSRKQDEMYVTEIGGCLEVKLESGQIVSVPFPKGTSLQMRTLYMQNFRKGGSFDVYGKWIQFRKLSAGEKERPNAIKCVEFRDSKPSII